MEFGRPRPLPAMRDNFMLRRESAGARRGVSSTHHPPPGKWRPQRGRDARPLPPAASVSVLSCSESIPDTGGSGNYDLPEGEEADVPSAKRTYPPPWWRVLTRRQSPLKRPRNGLDNGIGGRIAISTYLSVRMAIRSMTPILAGRIQP